ncbi:hypothetical protein ACFB49_14520 [Sphingomonas sp. DBB INV C78]|uniref:formate dehydrogenase subunit delta n=1 Tax=Sphingomonas sp. DBB INV C78 TaxID=3349434 RepID=UPI0036D40A58
MMSPDEKLVYMANQIARNFAVQGEAVAVAATAEHIGKYWDPRMRARIAILSADEAIGLDAITRAAIGIIRTKAA